MARQRSDDATRTYRRVVDMLRAGLNVSQAAEALADELGATPSAIRQRYYKVGEELGERTPAPARVRGERTKRATPPAASATIPEVDVATLLETAALMVAEAAKAIRDLERDAERWRKIRDALGDL